MASLYSMRAMWTLEHWNRVPSAEEWTRAKAKGWWACRTPPFTWNLYEFVHSTDQPIAYHNGGLRDRLESWWACSKKWEDPGCISTVDLLAFACGHFWRYETIPYDSHTPKEGATCHMRPKQSTFPNQLFQNLLFFMDYFFPSSPSSNNVYINKQLVSLLFANLLCISRRHFQRIWSHATTSKQETVPRQKRCISVGETLFLQNP